MGWFGEDILSALTGQSRRDKEKAARESAAKRADPLIASRISQYRQKYPHLTPGIVLSAAQAGLDVNDPAITRLAEAAAKRKVDKGQGWFSIGDSPLKFNPLAGVDIIARNLDDIADVAKTGVRWGLTALQSGAEGAQAAVRGTASRGLAKTIFDEGFTGLNDPIRATGQLGLLPKQDFSQSETTFGVAMDMRRQGQGSGIGQGFLPRGPSSEEQARRARETMFLEYADHPIFTLPGFKPETRQHAGTAGRIIAKRVTQPGSRPFNFISGIIDAVFTWNADPANKSLEAVSTLRQGRKVFSAEEMGLTGTKVTDQAVQGARTAREASGAPKSATAPFTSANEYLPGMHPDDIGIISQGVRPAIHPPTVQNWLTQSAPGRKFTAWVADNNSAYTIWKTLGGEKGNIAPDLAARMADSRTTDDVLSVLGDELGVGLRTKPLTSSFQPVGGYLGEVRNSASSNRLLNQMPHSAVHLEDAEESATQLVRLLRNGKLPEDDIGLLFNNLSRSVTTSDRGRVFMDAEVLLADHIASTLTGPVSGRPINFARLKGVFEKDLEAIQAVYRRQIGTNTEIKALDIDGQSIRLRSIHEDAEYFDTFYQLPDARAMRRITSQYGRLLNNKYLDVPIGLLDHMSSVWKGFTILRPALTLRVVGEEQVRMGAAGLDSIFRHPLSAISWAAATPQGKISKFISDTYEALPGTKLRGTMDVTGTPFPNGQQVADELTAFAKSQAKSATWRDRATSELRSVTPFTDPNFVKSWGKDIYRFHQDDVARRLANGGDEGIPVFHGTNKSFENFELRPSNYVGQGEVVFFTNNREAADRYSKMMTGGIPTIKSASIKPKKMAELTTEEGSFIPQAKIDELREAGYDSFKYTGKSGDISYGVLDPSIISTRVPSGNPVEDVKVWLKSDEGAAYRTTEDISLDAADGYVENVNNWLKGKTYGNQSLLDTIATGQFNGHPVFTVTDQGHSALSPGFQNHLKSLVDKDVSPDHTISDLGDIIYPRNSQQAKDIRGHVTDKLFNTLLTRPSNYLSRSPAFRQYYWQNIDTAFIHATPEAQAATLATAREANITKSTIKKLEDISSRASGDLTLDELDMFAKGHALSSTKGLLYDLSDRNQLLDAMRLVFPFGEAWKEVMTTWAKLTVANPSVIPKAALTVRGARGSGFFYTDPATGQEMFNYPGGEFVSKQLFGIPSPIRAAAGSLNMFSNNPLLPGFGPLVQVPVGKLLPDTPSNDFIRSVILPYGEPGSPLPSWAQKLHTAFTDPEKSTAYANTVMDVARYLVSTGEYDTSTDAGKQALEDAARSKAKLLYIFRGIAQAGLPAAPSYQDIAQDKDGHTTLAFTLTDRYRHLLQEDDAANTNLAVQRFIEEFGLPNLLYMQSASKGGDVFSKSGYDWVRSNPTIVSRYPDIYGLIAPNDGGFDIKAYQALFENGTRKTLPVSEALSLANHRAAKMVIRNAQSKLPPPSKRTDAQRLWLHDVKNRLVDAFPGYEADFQGTDIPNKIATLSRAVEDPLLANQPVTPAIRAYLSARSQVESIAAARKPPIIGWQTAKAMRTQRQWLREVATKITAQTPSFANVYDDLFDNELSDEEGA